MNKKVYIELDRYGFEGIKHLLELNQKLIVEEKALPLTETKLQERHPQKTQTYLPKLY